MSYCLRKSDIEDFLQYVGGQLDIDNLDLMSLIQDSKEWHKELILLSYLFAQFLEGMRDSTEDSESHTRSVYRVAELGHMHFKIEECDESFMDFVLRHVRNPRVSLVDELIWLVEAHRGHEYGNAIRV